MIRMGLQCPLLMAAITAIAQIPPVPATIQYQALLLQADGITPELGPVDLEFRLYAHMTSETALWGEQHDNVTLIEGQFTVELGAGAALASTPHLALSALFTGDPLWLGITVAGQNERTERQQFTAAPYALTANTAITAIHGVPPGTIAVWPGEEMPVGWVACDGTSYARSGDFAALFAVIGVTWGDGDTPGETFAVPNFGGRALVGATGSSGGQNDNSPGVTPLEAGLTDHHLGDLLGEETHRLTEAEMASHTHTYVDRHWTGSESSDWGAGHAMSNVYVDTARLTGYTGGVDTNSDGVPDAAAEHENMQPSLVMHFIIKY